MKKHVATLLLCTLVVTVYLTNRDMHMRQNVQDKELEAALVALQPNLEIVKMITELQTFDTRKPIMMYFRFATMEMQSY